MMVRFKKFEANNLISQQKMIQADNYAELSLPELIRDYARHIEVVEGL